MIICMILATLTATLFVYLFVSAGDNLQDVILSTCKENEQENVKRMNNEIMQIVKTVKRTGDIHNKKTVRKAQKIKKKLEEAEKHLKSLNSNKLDLLELIPLAGYRMIQLLSWDSTNNTIKSMYIKCQQFKEKKEAMNSTYYTLGTLIGFTVLGVFSFFVLLGLCLAMKMGTRSILVASIALIICMILGYLPYDAVNNTVKIRKEEIEWEFPRAVSQLALLTVAGMEVNQAWILAAGGGQGTLYDEMQRVVVDLDNNVLSVEAYSKFITRCNNKYTTKLATAILQNISKGNAEIVKLLRELNDESWLEHKHNARRMGEKIQSKLLVPTLLMFVGIIILIIIPVLSGFNF